MVGGDFTGMLLLLFTLFTDFTESSTFSKESIKNERYSEGGGGNGEPKASDLCRKVGLKFCPS